MCRCHSLSRFILPGLYLGKRMNKVGVRVSEGVIQVEDVIRHVSNGIFFVVGQIVMGRGANVFSPPAGAGSFTDAANATVCGAAGAEVPDSTVALRPVRPEVGI
jgi:hypothetical protein